MLTVLADLPWSVSNAITVGANLVAFLGLSASWIGKDQSGLLFFGFLLLWFRP